MERRGARANATRGGANDVGANDGVRGRLEMAWTHGLAATGTLVTGDSGYGARR